MDGGWMVIVVLHVAAVIHTGRSQDPCQPKVSRKEVFIPFGGTVLLNCTYTCERAFWESRLKKGDPQEGDGWIATNVTVSDWERSEIFCIDTQRSSVVTVIAYALPSRVTIDMPAEIEEGRQHNVTCTVAHVAPVQFLKIEVLRGDDVISIKTFQEDLRKDRQTVTETFQLDASRADDQQNFVCRATLQLGTVPNTTVESSAVTVRTYALPEDPDIHVSRWIEKGVPTEVRCQVRAGYPLENITMEMLFGSTPLDVNTSIDGHGTVVGTSALPGDSGPGSYSLTCTARVVASSRDSRLDVHIYEPLTMNFIVSHDTVDLGNNITTFCNITNNNNKNHSLFIMVNGQEVEKTSLSEAIYHVKADKREPTISVTCIAYLDQNQYITATASQNITVHYPPEFTEDSCPASEIWIDQRTKSFSCTAHGNPSPSVNCGSDEWSVNSGASFSVTRDMSGSYTCQASSVKGNASKSIQITVQYPPEKPTLVLSPNTTIASGDSFNLTCRTDALPAAVYHWTIPFDTHVTYSSDHSSVMVKPASSSHNGSYKCKVSNTWGRSEAYQEVVIARDYTILWILFAVIACVVVILGVIVIVCYRKWKNGRRGFYNLLHMKKSATNKSNTEVAMEEKNNHTV